MKSKSGVPRIAQSELDKVMIRPEESLLLILPCSPLDGALSLVLRLLFNPNELVPSHISPPAGLWLYPQHAAGCIVLGDRLGQPRFHRSDLQLCMTTSQDVWSLVLFFKTFFIVTLILQLSPITLHQYIPILYHQTYLPFWY